jgi:LysM repeat protein
MSNAKIRSVVFGAVLAFGLITVSASYAQQGQSGNSPALNPRHPDTYVVKRGDTLWDIAAMFLRDPWYWPEIWQINPQVANPHLIYPGDVLSLAFDGNGAPRVTLTRGTEPVEAGPTEKLSPRIRASAIEEAIPTVPYDTVRPFLSRPMVLEPGKLDDLPYLFANQDGLLGSAGRDVYVRGTDAPAGTVFDVVHAGEPLVDPDDDKIVGYQGIYVGQGRVRRAGDPATVFLTETAREASIGDYLIESQEAAPVNFFPSAPASNVSGRIMSVLDGGSMIGQYKVVVINRGARDGIEPGNVLSIFQAGAVVTDTTHNSRFSSEKVKLPDEMAGTMMVFRVYDRMSYALVMEATREIRVLDTVRNPET